MSELTKDETRVEIKENKVVVFRDLEESFDSEEYLREVHKLEQAIARSKDQTADMEKTFREWQIMFVVVCVALPTLVVFGVGAGMVLVVYWLVKSIKRARKNQT